MEKYTIDEQFLGRWANNNLTKEELTFFKQSPDFEIYQKIYKRTEDFKPAYFDSSKGFEDLKNRLQNPPKTKIVSIFNKTNYIISGIAASLILVLGIFFFNSTDEVINSTGIAEKTEVTLPDGSIVKLNANSSLSYNKKTFTQNRTLNLKGEAYFKVAKGSKFTVVSDLGTVKVLGTQFNVITRKNLFETICYEGRVQVNSDKTEKILNPTDGIRFLNQTKEDLKINVKQPSWISNLSHFSKMKLELIIDELQNQYNIKIDSKKIDTNQLVTTYFTHKDLDKALETIFLPLKVKYRYINNNEIILE